MEPNPPGVMEKNNKLMMKMDRERLARQTRKDHGIEMHGDIPAKKKSVAKKMEKKLPHMNISRSEYMKRFKAVHKDIKENF